MKMAMHYLVAGFIGLVSGVTSGLFGVGGGVVMVPAMMYFMKLDIKTAIGTSLAVIIPTAFSGAFKHYHLGHVSWPIALSLAPMAMVGSYLGAKAAGALPSDVLKRMFGAFLVIIGFRLLLAAKA